MNFFLIFILIIIFQIIIFQIFIFIRQYKIYKNQTNSFFFIKFFSNFIAKIYKNFMFYNSSFKTKIFDFFMEFNEKLFKPNYIAVKKIDLKNKNVKTYKFATNLKDKHLLAKLNFQNNKIYKNYYKKKYSLKVYKNNFQNNQIFPILKILDVSLIVLHIKLSEDFIMSSEIYTKNYNIISLNILKLVMLCSAFCMKIINEQEEILYMSESSLEVLSRVVDFRSHNTQKHTNRVTYYAKKILEKIDFKKFPEIKDIDRFKKEIEIASILHDVGKIGVKDSILNKEDELSDTEWEIMQNHVSIGEQIISPMKNFEYVRSAVLYHHEKYNGEGYLAKLKGEEIPLGARIISIVDSYDAMTSDRVYKKARSKQESINELRKYSGSQFDKYLTDIFLEYLENAKDDDI